MVAEDVEENGKNRLRFIFPGSVARFFFWFFDFFAVVTTAVVKFPYTQAYKEKNSENNNRKMRDRKSQTERRTHLETN